MREPSTNVYYSVKIGCLLLGLVALYFETYWGYVPFTAFIVWSAWGRFR